MDDFENTVNVLVNGVCTTIVVIFGVILNCIAINFNSATRFFHVHYCDKRAKVSRISKGAYMLSPRLRCSTLPLP